MRIVLAIVPLIFAVTAMAAETGQGSQADIKITLKDYKFVPEQITARAGQRVIITLANASTEKLHEFMIGRKVVKGHSHRPAGYAEDFFGSVDIEPTISRASGGLARGRQRSLAWPPREDKAARR